MHVTCRSAVSKLEEGREDRDETRMAPTTLGFMSSQVNSPCGLLERDQAEIREHGSLMIFIRFYKKGPNERSKAHLDVLSRAVLSMCFRLGRDLAQQNTHQNVTWLRILTASYIFLPPQNKPETWAAPQRCEASESEQRRSTFFGATSFRASRTRTGCRCGKLGS